MQDVTNPIQKLSYTNKDFLSIYPEMLDLVKTLTNKWDPSLSNESDPGVVLLKLCAIIADKTNFNTDTAVLETFPISVTQSTNARKLFEQLGYYMKSYISATCTVSMAWSDPIEGSDIYYTMPAFSTVADETSSIVYTLIGPAEGLSETEFKVGSQRIPQTGEIVAFKAIQGVPVTYSVNGNTTITFDMLDSENRIYLPYSDIAENGIFICNEGLENYNSWVKKDNLYIEDVSDSNHYYKFSLSQDNLSSYIEFPVNIEELMLNGLNITYIRSSGEAGNIAANMLTTMYSAIIPAEDSSVSLTSSTLTITNPGSGSGGADPESIDDAYRGYKQTIGTFDTLVSLRDYFNYIMRSGLVSNGFVCDRTNDVQSVTKVMNTSNDVSQLVSEVKQHQATKTFSNLIINSSTEGTTGNLHNVNCEVFEDELTAFSLKFYLLQYSSETSTAAGFSKTFDMVLPEALSGVEAYVDTAKLITHEYVDIQPTTTEFPNVCMIKNRYPLNCRIIPQYTLTVAEKNEIKENIYKALYNGLNAVKLTFGEELDLDYIYDILTNADTRIRSVFLDSVTYTTYAICYNGVNYVEIPINEVTDSITLEYQPHGIDEDAKLNWDCSVISPSQLEAKMAEWRTNHPELFTQSLGATMTWNFWIKHVFSNNTWTHTYHFKPSNSTATEAQCQVTASQCGLSFTEKELTQQSNEPNSEYHVIIPQQYTIREDIYAKSALAGATQFLVKDESVDLAGNQFATTLVEDVAKIKPELEITLHSNTYSDPNGNIYTMKENESVKFYAPNLLDSTTYSNYTRFECLLNDNIASDVDYRLGPDECIIFYWKESSNTDDVYKYAAYGEGCIIKPSEFTLQKNSSTLVGDKLRQLLFSVTTTPKQLTYKQSGDMLPTISKDISDGLGTSYNVLSGTKSVSIRQMNSISLTSSNYFCYWITSDITENNRYQLFSGEETIVDGIQSRTLGTGEYFYYSNSAMTNMVVLGSGTKISRTASSTPWEVEVVQSSDIYEEGTAALADSWFTIPTATTVTVMENQTITVPTGYDLRLDVSDYTILQQKVMPLNEYCKEQDISTGEATTKTLTSQPVVDVATLINTCKDSFTNLGGTSGYATVTFKYTNTTAGEWTLDDTVIGGTTWATGLSAYGITLDAADQPGSDLTKRYVLTISLDNDWTVTIDSSGVDVSAFDLKYKPSNDTVWTSIPNIRLGEGYNWMAHSILSLDLSSTVPQHLQSNQSIEVFCGTDDTSAITIEGQDGGYRKVFTDIDISLVTGTTYYWYYLGDYYVLSFSAIPSTKMPGTTFAADPSEVSLDIYPGYRASEFTYTLTTQSTAPTGSAVNISDKISDVFVYPVSVLADKVITSSVNGEVTTVVIDDDLNRVYSTLYEFAEFTSTNTESTVVYNQDKTVYITPSDSRTSCTFMFSVPSENGSDFLLPVYCSNEDLTFSLAYRYQGQSGSLYPIDDSTMTSFSGGKSYYLKFTLNNPGTGSGAVKQDFDTLSIVVSWTGSAEATFRLGNLYKYDFATLTEIFPYLTQATAEQLILHRMGCYDPSKLFDYTYVVGDENIVNPLDSYSFFSSAHPFNPFTIPQFESSLSKITFTK